MSSRIQLLAGLGNPGPQYAKTRHNAGFWFIDAIARAHGITLKFDSKFSGEVGKGLIDGTEVWLLKPMTFMNRSGQGVAALARFYRIDAENILIAHDELDLPPGTVRLKQGGGHGGHNGLRDTIAQLGSREFQRLRLGIGHPGHASQVSGYVLSKASGSDQQHIEEAVDKALDNLSLIVSGDQQKAMNRLHSQ
ncbi:MAG: aminoacyl-tRNA hydrolase [Gammaproteobacteria bacterium]|nr:aminoacyl-tRNA hydrolase [Gammaproteobacteria bacterium]